MFKFCVNVWNIQIVSKTSHYLLYVTSCYLCSFSSLGELTDTAIFAHVVWNRLGLTAPIVIPVKYPVLILVSWNQAVRLQAFYFIYYYNLVSLVSVII